MLLSIAHPDMTLDVARTWNINKRNQQYIQWHGNMFHFALNGTCHCILWYIDYCSKLYWINSMTICSMFHWVTFHCISCYISLHIMLYSSITGHYATYLVEWYVTVGNYIFNDMELYAMLYLVTWYSVPFILKDMAHWRAFQCVLCYIALHIILYSSMIGHYAPYLVELHVTACTNIFNDMELYAMIYLIACTIYIEGHGTFCHLCWMTWHCVQCYDKMYVTIVYYNEWHVLIYHAILNDMEMCFMLYYCVAQHRMQWYSAWHDLFVLLGHSNSISIISWRDAWDKQKTRTYSFTNPRDL